MKANWQEIATNLLSEHVGALAQFVVEDAIAKCRVKPEQMPSAFVAEFILRVAQELPESVNRAAIAAELRSAIR